jgi:hypothetical protein
VRRGTHQHRGDRRLERVAGRRGDVALQRIHHALRGEGRRHGNQGRVHVVLRDQRGQGVRAVVGPCMIHIMEWMDGSMDRWIDGWIDGWADGWADEAHRIALETRGKCQVRRVRSGRASDLTGAPDEKSRKRANTRQVSTSGLS